MTEPVAKGSRSTRFANAVKCAVERGMTAADFEALCRANPQGCAAKYLPPERHDELHKRIAEIWAPHAAEVEKRDALGAELVKGLLENHAASKKPQTSKVQIGEWVRSFGDAADPLIEDIDGGEIIGRAQQGVLYGPQGTGKTAVAIELAHAIATGSGMGIQHLTAEPVYRSMKGRVLFAIYEDPYDFRRRMIALAQVRGVDLDVLDWAIVSADLNVTRERDRASLLQRIRNDAAANGAPALLVVDTVAAALGAESSNDDDTVGKLFSLSQVLAGEFMCTSVFVAHPGKDETRGIAGSYRFTGNSDFILRAIEIKNGLRLVKDKDRNGPKRALFDYTLNFVEVECTASGKPRTGAIIGTMTACLQQSMAQHVAPAAKDRWPKSLRIFRKAMETALGDGKLVKPFGDGPTVRAVPDTAVRAEFMAAYAADGDDPEQMADTKRKAFRRALSTALERELVVSREIGGVDHFWFADLKDEQ